MSIDTERIYKITEDNFYGITQGTRVIIDDEGNITGRLQNPVATIRYDDRLITVEPRQVEFIEEQESGNVWHVGSDKPDTIDAEKEYAFCEGHADWLGKMLDEQTQTTADNIISYAQSIGNENMICEFNDKGFKELIITWEE